MIVTLRIPDKLYEKYVEHNRSNPQQAMEKQLERFADHSTSDRVLVFPAEGRKEVEKLFGTPIEDVSKFVNWLKSLVSIRVSEVEVPLRAGQLKSLCAQAEGRKIGKEKYIRDQVQVALDREFGLY